MQSTLIRKIEWRSVEGYDNYEVSDTGLVRNKTTGRVLKPKINTKGYEIVNLYREDAKPRHWLVHRLVAMAFIDNPDGKPCVDHIDRDVRNNCVSNLRWATLSENGMNKKKCAGNTSGYKGVTFDKSRDKWTAQIKKDGKKHFLGRFTNEGEAAAAYDMVATEMFGEFACINPAPAPPVPKIAVKVTIK